MYGRFNNSFQQNGFQNINPGPQGSNNIYPYPQQYFTPPMPQVPQMPQMAPQAQGMQGMNQDMYQQDPFQPFQSPQVLGQSPLASSIYPASSPYADNYAKGGQVRPSRNQLSGNSYSSLAELIRQQGEGEDKILAHINPIEAQMLARNSGGDINPVTGLPQFGRFKKFFKKIGKAFGKNAGGIGGAVIGNMIVPGLGGVIGGTLGNVGGAAMRHDKNILGAALRGAGIGAALPSLSGFAGAGASKLGAGGLGNYLTNYGNTNAILPAFGKLMGGSTASGNALSPSIGFNPLSALSSSGGFNPLNALMASGSNPILSSFAGEAGPVGGMISSTGGGESGSFLDTLLGKSKDFMTEPKNLLSLGVLGSSFLNRPKKVKSPEVKSPEQLADEQKRYNRALLLTPAERAEKEAHDLAALQSQRKIERDKFLPEERLHIPELYRRTRTPEEYANTGSWFDWYNNPEFKGSPIPYYKKGGLVPHMEHEATEVEYPKGLGYYIKGETGGQDDRRKVQLPNKAYVVNASTVSDLGDGNSDAGARKLDAYVSDGEYVVMPDEVTNIFGNGNSDKGVKRLDMMVKNIYKHKRTGGKFPPKAKSLASYISR